MSNPVTLGRRTQKRAATEVDVAETPKSLFSTDHCEREPAQSDVCCFIRRSDRLRRRCNSRYCDAITCNEDIRRQNPGGRSGRGSIVYLTCGATGVPYRAGSGTNFWKIASFFARHASSATHRYSWSGINGTAFTSALEMRR